jgi:hypothetical protein
MKPSTGCTHRFKEFVGYNHFIGYVLRSSELAKTRFVTSRDRPPNLPIWACSAERLGAYPTLPSRLVLSRYPDYERPVLSEQTLRPPDPIFLSFFSGFNEKRLIYPFLGIYIYGTSLFLTNFDFFGEILSG